MIDPHLGESSSVIVTRSPKPSGPPSALSNQYHTLPPKLTNWVPNRVNFEALASTGTDHCSFTQSQLDSAIGVDPLSWTPHRKF